MEGYSSVSRGILFALDKNEKNMRIIFCLPGKTFSAKYFTAWNNTIAECSKNGLSYAYSMAYDPVVYYTRNKILGGDNTKGKTQKPWQGQVEYDYMVWIDSDIIWQPNDILQLLSHDKPIVAGTYMMENLTHYPIVESLDFAHLAQQGVFKFIDSDSMSQKTNLFQVSYTGFGFVAIKNGVMEALEYPWFRPRWVENDQFYDFCAEDVGFCWTAQEKGFEIFIDPKIRVGHEKTMVI